MSFDQGTTPMARNPRKNNAPDLVLALVTLAGCSAGDASSTDDAPSEFRCDDEFVAVDPAKELVITDASVIDSALETTFDPAHPSGASKKGAWSFGRLVHNMLPKGQRKSSAAASELVFDWLHSWEVDQSPNVGVAAAQARPAIRLLVTNPWKAASGCAIRSRRRRMRRVCST